MRSLSWRIPRLLTSLALAIFLEHSFAQPEIKDAEAKDLAELLDRTQLAVPIELKDVESKKARPTHMNALRTFEATRLAALRTLSTDLPGPSGWSYRERLLMAECVAAQAASLIATRTLGEDASVSRNGHHEDVRAFHLAVAEWLDDTPRRLLDEYRSLKTERSHIQALVPSKRLTEIEEASDIVPWFDKDIAFLAVSGAGSLALSPRIRPQLPVELLDRKNSDEKFLDWSQRQCARLMFIRSDHVDYLEADAVDTRQMDTATKHSAKGLLRLRNVGPRRLVGSTQVVMLSDAPGAAYDARIEEVMTIPIDLQPLGKAEQPFHFELPKKRGRIVRFLPIGPEGSPTSVEPVGGRVEISTCVERAIEHKSRPVMMEVLSQYAAAAPKRFSELAVEPLGKHRMQAPGRLAVPGAEATVVNDFGRTASVVATMYSGDSKSRAREAFDVTVASVRSYCGQAVGELGVNENARPGEKSTFYIKMFSPDADLTINLSQRRPREPTGASSRYLVTLEVGRHGRAFP